jgi:hypothetical protein
MAGHTWTTTVNDMNRLYISNEVGWYAAEKQPPHDDGVVLKSEFSFLTITIVIAQQIVTIGSLKIHQVEKKGKKKKKKKKKKKITLS